jgi:branched-chain amino acid transport system ATP-binding protein
MQPRPDGLNRPDPGDGGRAPKARGQSVLVIDKNIENLTRIADRHYIIERGRAVWSGTSQALIDEPDLQHKYLGI